MLLGFNKSLAGGRGGGSIFALHQIKKLHNTVAACVLLLWFHISLKSHAKKHIFYQILISIQKLVWNNGNIHMCNWEILKPKEDNHIRLYSPILSRCSLPSRSFLFSILSPFIIIEGLKELRYCMIGPGGLCSDIANFCRTEGGLTSKWGRISPAIHC